MKRRELAATIEHTLLKSDATTSDVRRLCADAVELHCAAVCVNGFRVREAKEHLTGTAVRLTAVVGFPLGAGATEIKAAEAAQVVRDGADEVDMVMNVGLIREGEYDRFRRDVAAVVEAAGGAPVKVILETVLLDDPQKVRATRIAVAAGARFIKTSTGFQGGGATVHDVLLVKEVVPPGVGIKASGGIRTTELAVDLVTAGATRLGMSATREVLLGIAV